MEPGPLCQPNVDDELLPGGEMLGADIPHGFRLHMSPPTVLDESLV